MKERDRDNLGARMAAVSCMSVATENNTQDLFVHLKSTVMDLLE